MSYNANRAHVASTSLQRYAPSKKFENIPPRRQRRKDAQKWRDSVKSLIEMIHKYRNYGGKDELLNNKIRDYLDQLQLDYNKYVIKGETTEQIVQKHFFDRARITQKMTIKTFKDFVRETNEEREEQTKRNLEQENKVCVSFEFALKVV